MLICATCLYIWWQRPQSSSSSLREQEDSGRVSRQVVVPSSSASSHHRLCPLVPVPRRKTRDRGGPSLGPSSSCGSSSCDAPLPRHHPVCPPLSPARGLRWTREWSFNTQSEDVFTWILNSVYILSCFSALHFTLKLITFSHCFSVSESL